MPTRRPALPRVSSAMSGFFFCGIIDDPVAKASSRLRNPNSEDDQSTTSSPIRLRWTPRRARTNRASATKSRSLVTSSEFSNTAPNPRSRAVAAGSSGSDEPASAPAPAGTRRCGAGRRAGGRRPGTGPRRGPPGGGPGGPAGPAGGGCSRGGGRHRRPGPFEEDLLEVEDPAGHPWTGPPGPTAGTRWPPGRCGSARCGACRRPLRPARSPGARWRCGRPRPTARRPGCRRPAPPRLGRGRRGRRPARRRSAARCGPGPGHGPAEPRTSQAASRTSNERLSVKASRASSGPPSKRPCQSVWPAAVSHGPVPPPAWPPGSAGAGR